MSAKKKPKATKKAASRKVQLPAGYKAITSGEFAPSWDFETESTIEGTLIEKRTTIQNKGKKDEREVHIFTIRRKDGSEVTVWESYGLKPLIDVKKGKQVFIGFLGYKAIKGRKQPMKDFIVAVK